jgi:hypothetical protein
MKFFEMMTKSLEAFTKSFDKYEEYCDVETLTVPCEMFRYTYGTTVQEVVGTLKSIVENVIEGCVEGFGWQWVTTINGLSAAVGGVIPQIIIPNVSGKWTNF